MSSNLTKRQKEILDFISEFQESNDLAPTLEEIAAHFGISKPTAYEHVKALEDKSRLTRDRYRQRSIQVQPEESPPPPSRTTASAAGFGSSLPDLRVIGRVAAGRPIEMVEDVEPEQLLSLIPTEGCFALEVRGDSMVEDGIRDGDFVILENRKEAKNGETVVAVVDKQEATLKRWRRIGREVRLEPRNSALAPLVLDASRVEVCGVLVGLVRRY